MLTLNIASEKKYIKSHKMKLFFIFFVAVWLYFVKNSLGGGWICMIFALLPYDSSSHFSLSLCSSKSVWDKNDNKRRNINKNCCGIIIIIKLYRNKVADSDEEGEKVGLANNKRKMELKRNDMDLKIFWNDVFISRKCSGWTLWDLVSILTVFKNKT